MTKQSTKTKSEISYLDFKNEVLKDFQILCESREASILGRKEVLTGKAKFGIFGAGKELAQIAMAKVFKNGDWRSGYYRDQTFALATGMVTVPQLFAQLYSDPSPGADPHSGGRQMNAHFATRSIDENGDWLDLMAQKNTSPDLSPTAGQCPRAVGLSLASKLYRENESLSNKKGFSSKGNEVTFVTIGDASCAEGIFWESLNAAVVQQIPMAISVWDDGYGISVPTKYQIAKSSISEAIKGFKTTDRSNGIDIYTVKGWDYPELMQTYARAIDRCRRTHIPCLIHVQEVTQPQGHSTSGSHERYKSAERLKWEEEYDCKLKMRDWISKNGLASIEELDKIEQEAKESIAAQRKMAYETFLAPVRESLNGLVSVLTQVSAQSPRKDEIDSVIKALNAEREPLRRILGDAALKVLRITKSESVNSARINLIGWKDDFFKENYGSISSFLYNQTKHSALNVEEVKPIVSDSSSSLNGSEVLRNCFDAAFEKYPELIAFGEDLGKIGGVNQGMAGLQEKYGAVRIFDTGIREATIMGQGIGLALRGFKPIAEIQYLDYLAYGLQILTDDLATLHYRSNGIQISPMIIRTRGHRLEGIWHTGSPLGMILSALRGIYVLVPRNMVQAAGFYNTMLQSKDSALIIEVLNGYRLKEKLPENIAEYTLPLGVPEVILEGHDITLVTYGACVRIAEKAVEMCTAEGISVELIDVQSLLPFDKNKMILESLKKTNKIVFLDEDVPGGGTAFMMQKVIDEHEGFRYLDSKPKCVSANEHRAAYASDGDYFSKPNAETIFQSLYEMMNEYNPQSYPIYY